VSLEVVLDAAGVGARINPRRVRRKDGHLPQREASSGIGPGLFEDELGDVIKRMNSP
jgi:hypothetical protein